MLNFHHRKHYYVSGWIEFSIMDPNDGNNSIGEKTIN